jgi:hypothetical protein
MAFWVVYTTALIFVAVCFAGAAYAYFRPRRKTKARQHHHGTVFDGRCAALVAQRILAPRTAIAEARLIKPLRLDTKGLDETAEFEAILEAIAASEPIELPRRQPA